MQTDVTYKVGDRNEFVTCDESLHTSSCLRYKGSKLALDTYSCRVESIMNRYTWQIPQSNINARILDRKPYPSPLHCRPDRMISFTSQPASNTMGNSSSFPTFQQWQTDLKWQLSRLKPLMPARSGGRNGHTGRRISSKSCTPSTFKRLYAPTLSQATTPICSGF